MSGATVIRLWVAAGWVLSVAVVVLWPVSMLTFARHEPPTVLSLSWCALLLAALGILVTAQMQKRVTLDADGDSDARG